MRLQLALVILIAAAGDAAAQVADTEPGDGAVDSTVAVYADDDATTVLTSLFEGSIRLPVPAQLDAHFLIDAVSSASVDVVSAATTRWKENRIEAGAGAVARVAETDVSLAYTTSGENDWRSHAIVGGVARELAQKNTTVSAGYGFTSNRIGRAFDPTFERSLTVHGAELAVTQLIDRRTSASLSYTLQRSDGYHASPYRFVTTMTGLAAPETHPDARTRHGITARVLRAIGKVTSIDASYRTYVDDWGVWSQTISATLTRELGESLDLRLRARGYFQEGADFYHEAYQAPTRYMSADRELSTFWDATAGLKLSWHRERLTIDAKVDGSYYRFLDFARLAGRVALVAGGGVRWQW